MWHRISKLFASYVSHMLDLPFYIFQVFDASSMRWILLSSISCYISRFVAFMDTPLLCEAVRYWYIFFSCYCWRGFLGLVDFDHSSNFCDSIDCWITCITICSMWHSPNEINVGCGKYFENPIRTQNTSKSIHSLHPSFHSRHVPSRSLCRSLVSLYQRRG